MTNLQLDTTIKLHAHRCAACGRWSASEDGSGWACPPCGIAARDAMFNRMSHENDRLGRVVRSLRGVITRMRRRG